MRDAARELGAHCRKPGPTGCRTWGDSSGGSGRTRPPRAARLSPLLRVSAERRPQEAAPREAAADRRAQRQTSKRAGACAHPLPRWGGGVAGHFGSTLKSADLGAARAYSQRTPGAVLKVTRAPFSGKKERGSRRPRGESAGAERQKLHLEGGEQPGVHLELVDMFLECGHFSRLGVGTARWCEAGGGGSRGRWFGPGHRTTWRRFLGSIANLIYGAVPLGAPSPHFFSITFYSWNLTPAPRNKRKAPPGPPGSAPSLV